MKTLILFISIFVYSLSNAQTLTHDSLYIFSSGNIGIGSSVSPKLDVYGNVGLLNGIEPNDTLNINCSVIQLLFEYEAECKKDSFQVKTWIDPNHKTDLGNGVGISTAIAGGYYKIEWKHKEPTFSDFIQWLKSKGI